VGDIDRVNQLAQTAQAINAFQRVNPADQRQSPKQERGKGEEQSDKVELSQEEQESQEEPDEKPEEAEVVDLKLEEGAAGEHLDIAV
jgi:anti-sigma28 factor (negative regulator of flagellin synthesis)